MTLEESIKLYESNAEYERTHGSLQGCLNFRQLAEWLTDYKRLKEQGGDTISRQAVFDALEKVSELFPWRVPGKYETYDSYNEAWHDSIGRAEMEIEGLPPVNPQRTGHWIYDKNLGNWRCSECGETPKTLGYCGTADFMLEHFKYCNHCGIRMIEPQKRSVEV